MLTISHQVWCKYMCFCSICNRICHWIQILIYNFSLRLWGKKVKASHKSWNKNTSQDYVTKTWCKNTSQYVMYFYLTRLVWGIFTSQLMQVRCIFTSRLVWGIFTSRFEWVIFTSRLVWDFLLHDSCEIFSFHESSKGMFYLMTCMRYFYLTTCLRYFVPTIYVP